MTPDSWRAWAKASKKARPALMALLIQENEGLIQHFVQRFSKARDFPDHLREDFAQAARIGFIRAVETWKPAPEGPSPFSHWAFLLMRQEVQKVACGALPVALPRDILFASTHKTDAHQAQFGEDPPDDHIGRRERTHAKIMGWKFFYTADYLDEHLRRQPTATEAQAVPDAEGDLDHKRGAERLGEFLAMLSKKDRKAFWAGNRPDLITQAKAYVATR